MITCMHDYLQKNIAVEEEKYEAYRKNAFTFANGVCVDSYAWSAEAEGGSSP